MNDIGRVDILFGQLPGCMNMASEADNPPSCLVVIDRGKTEYAYCSVFAQSVRSDVDRLPSATGYQSGPWSSSTPWGSHLHV